MMVGPSCDLEGSSPELHQKNQNQGGCSAARCLLWPLFNILFWGSVWFEDGFCKAYCHAYSRYEDDGTEKSCADGRAPAGQIGRSCKLLLLDVVAVHSFPVPKMPRLVWLPRKFKQGFALQQAIYSTAKDRWVSISSPRT